MRLIRSVYGQAGYSSARRRSDDYRVFEEAFRIFQSVIEPTLGADAVCLDVTGDGTNMKQLIIVILMFMSA
jgi:hypothetical protein